MLAAEGDVAMGGEPGAGAPPAEEGRGGGGAASFLKDALALVLALRAGGVRGGPPLGILLSNESGKLNENLENWQVFSSSQLCLAGNK